MGACCSQSVREAKAASHVLQTLWSYKDLRGALQKEGWTKARFQVWLIRPVLSPYQAGSPRGTSLTPTPVCFVPPAQSAAANAKGAKGTPSPGGFDDSTLPLGDKSLGEFGAAWEPSLRFKSDSSIQVHW